MEIQKQCVRDVRAILLRYFNPIGAHPSALIGELPSGVPQNLVPYLTQTAIGIREKLSVFGDDYHTPDGSCIRDYIYVVDLAKAHVVAMNRILQDKQKEKVEVFNIGTGRGLSVLELIHAFEAATGVNILIDDTPEAVVISCFDPIRKEVARLLIERLISDGRIHPTRIEELVKKITKEVEEDAFSAGEAAVLETGIQGASPQVIRLLGRLKYRYSFSQNVLKHSLETAYFMGIIAAELGLDEQKAKRIGLFHDIGKAVDHEIEGSHAQIGADILRRHNEAKDVIQAVAAHHAEIEPVTPYDILINACDTLSASRPGARSETTELYLRRLEQLESIARDFQGVESCYALQAGREVRVVVLPEKIAEGEAQMLAKNICQRIEKEMNYPGQIKITVIRETRSVEYAK